jgi:hypothetical protein
MVFSNKNEVGEIFGRLNVMCKFALLSLVNSTRANKQMPIWSFTNGFVQTLLQNVGAVH